MRGLPPRSTLHGFCTEFFRRLFRHNFAMAGILNANSLCCTAVPLLDCSYMARQIESPSTAVERTLLILEAAGQREGGMSNADFSRKLKIPKSSASYILRTLEQHGYLRRYQNNRKPPRSTNVSSTSLSA